MNWAKQGDVLPDASASDPDHLRAWEPSIVEEDDGTLRMWYSGHDGTTGRILEAVQAPGRPWRRVGVAVDAGLAGDSDQYGVEGPCVVQCDGEYLMVYAGFDGGDTCLHLATSPDGHDWAAAGPIAPDDSRPLAGGTPSLLISAEQWWLFYSSRDPHGAEIFAAVAKPGGPWDPIGSVLKPEPGEVAVSHPCVVEISRTLHMFYATENEQHCAVALATSDDGVDWERRGIAVSATDGDPDTWAVTAPCVVRLRDGALWMWYSRRPWGDDRLAYTIGAAVLSGRWPGTR